jgi:glycosyltransferase involved in cell wall biosynthesis
MRNDNATVSCSVIIPVYNEMDILYEIVYDLTAIIAARIDLEIIIVDDGSNFETKKILNSIDTKYDIKLITLSQNSGYGAAIKTGLKHVKRSHVAFFDSDGQHRVIDLFQLLNQSSVADVVIGFRDPNYIQSRWRFTLIGLLKFFFYWSTNKKSLDPTSGLRIWESKKIKSIMHLCSDGFSFAATSLLISYFLNFKILWFPVTMEKRTQGKSHFRPLKIFRILVKLLSLQIIFSPMRVFGPIVTLFISLGTFFIINNYFYYGEASLKGLLLLITGIILFFNGLSLNSYSKIQKSTILSQLGNL